jgi:aspartate/tyrosine/aromatic aminotransferase
MNDEERRLWILNNESLYHWWRLSYTNMKSFIKNNRTELTECINKLLNKKD